MYDDKNMLKVVQHATASALNNQEASATFLLLPNWMKNSTNAFHKTCTDNEEICILSWKYPKDKTRYMPLLSKAKHQPCQKQLGHAHPSSMEQGCQGATYDKQPILG
jgi:hypothetical protein